MRPSEEFVYEQAKRAGMKAEAWGRVSYSDDLNEAMGSSWTFVRHTPDLIVWEPGEEPYAVEVKCPDDSTQYPSSVTVKPVAANAYINWHHELSGRLIIACVFGGMTEIRAITAPDILDCRVTRDGLYVVQRLMTKPFAQAFQPA
jgi:hypothetical protein